MKAVGERLGFERQYLKLRSEYARLRRGAGKHDDILGTLLREGLVVLPGFLDTGRAAELKAAAPPVEECRLSPEGTLTRFFSDAREIPELQPFFGSELIAETMCGALGPSATMLRSTVQYRTTVGHTGAFEHFFHIDSWLPRYKAFLYLTDVDEAHGPFVYTPRTHYGTWRRGYDRDIARVFRAGTDGYIHDEASAYVGCVWPHEHAAICARLGTSPRAVTGPPGTLLIFDARGLHRIRPLERAPRIILSSYWVREGRHT